MVSSSDASKQKRKDKTLIAHRMLLNFDEKDKFGSVTFHFKKGEGIVRSEIREFESFNGTYNDNNVLTFNG